MTALPSLVSSLNSSSVDTSFGTSVTNTPRTGSGFVTAVCATNVNAALRWLQLYNGAAATGTPLLAFPIPAGTAATPGGIILDSSWFGPNGIYFGSGITWAISTAAASYAAATPADHTINVAYQ